MTEEKDLMGKMIKVYTTDIVIEQGFALQKTERWWARGEFLGSVLIGKREFIHLRWKGDGPKERLVPIDTIMHIEIETI